MKLMSRQKLLGCVLVVSLIVNSFTMRAFAIDSVSGQNSSSFVAKTALLNNIDDYGLNWGNDSTTGDEYITSDTTISQSCNGNNIIISTQVSGQNITIVGTPVGKAESGNVLYFEGSVNNDDYSVVTFSYEKNLKNSNVYFDNYMNSNNKDTGNLLKIYLKENNSNAKNYIILEVFDYSLPYDEESLSNLPVNALPGAWVVDEFKPVESEEVEIPTTYATTNTIYRTISSTFTEGVLSQTHKITLRFTADYSDVPVGDETIQNYRVTVDSKSITVPDASNYNSSTQSSLHVSGITLQQTCMPYTAWIRANIDGLVLTTTTSAELSANISVNFGALGLSLSIPLNFNFYEEIDLDSSTTDFDNYVDENGTGHYARHLQTVMDSDYRLTEVGHYFLVKGTLRDYGNASRSAQTLYSKWIVEIVNASTLEFNSYAYTQNVSVAIN